MQAPQAPQAPPAAAAGVTPPTGIHRYLMQQRIVAIGQDFDIRNERGEIMSRQVVGVGALRPTEARVFTLAVEVAKPGAR